MQKSLHIRIQRVQLGIGHRKKHKSIFWPKTRFLPDYSLDVFRVFRLVFNFEFNKRKRWIGPSGFRIRKDFCTVTIISIFSWFFKFFNEEKSSCRRSRFKKKLKKRDNFFKKCYLVQNFILNNVLNGKNPEFAIFYNVTTV